MTFRAATDRATEVCITLADIASACGVSLSTVDRARLDPETSPNARPAPAGWQVAVAKLARKRAAELVRLAEQVERRA